MTFHGIGSGKKGGWNKRRYNLQTGEVQDGPRMRQERTTAVHTRFRPFMSPQVNPDDAKACGLTRKGKMTCFSTEKDLNRYLAWNKHNGRDVGWKDS